MAKLRFSKKTFFILLVVILLIAGGTVFAIKKKSNKKENNSPQNQITDTQSDGQASNAPTKIENRDETPEDKSPSLPTLDKQLPAGTIKPSTVAANPNQYFGKTLKIRGLIVDIGDGKYDVIDQNSEPNSPSLRLSSNIDLQKYSNSTSKSQGSVHFADPVTISGILVKPQKGQFVTLNVKAIN